MDNNQQDNQVAEQPEVEQVIVVKGVPLKKAFGSVCVAFVLGMAVNYYRNSDEIALGGNAIENGAACQQLEAHIREELKKMEDFLTFSEKEEVNKYRVTAVSKFFNAGADWDASMTWQCQIKKYDHIVLVDTDERPEFLKFATNEDKIILSDGLARKAAEITADLAP